MNVGQNHFNRSVHNWLIYDVSDRYLSKAIPHYKGKLDNNWSAEAVGYFVTARKL